MGKPRCGFLQQHKGTARVFSRGIDIERGNVGINYRQEGCGIFISIRSNKSTQSMTPNDDVTEETIFYEPTASATFLKVLAKIRLILSFVKKAGHKQSCLLYGVDKNGRFRQATNKRE